MIVEDTPTLRAVNPLTWIKKTDYLELEFRPSLRSFATQRADLLAVLEPLPHEGWSRAATVTGAAKVPEPTVRSYAQCLARPAPPPGQPAAPLSTPTHLHHPPPPPPVAPP